MTFLEQVSEAIIHKHQAHWGDLTVVFPNRRTGLFFREILSKKIDAPTWAPQFYTFEELMAELSQLQRPDKLTLIFMLYLEYRKYHRPEETFDQFYFWGDMLIEDFSEIDKSLIRASDLFANLRDLKELDARYDYLTEAQQQIIARFWRSFDYRLTPELTDQPLSKTKHEFLEFWRVLHTVYTEFRAHLLQEGLAYEGMMTRRVAESVEHLWVDNPFPHLAFVGFNAFYPAEEKVVSWLVDQAGAEMYWNLDALYVEDPVQEAGIAFRRYQRHSVLAQTLPRALPRHFFSGQKRQIHMTGVTLEVGQAKYVGEQLQQLSQQPGFQPEKVAIVLPDENLLFPMLHALPPSIRRVNVTMGYPLRNTALYSLVEHVLQLQEEKKLINDQYAFHHTSVLALLRHPYVAPMALKEAQALINQMVSTNRIYVSTDTLHTHEFFRALFRPITKTSETFDYLLLLLRWIHHNISPQEEGSEIGLEEPDFALPVLEQELVYHLYIHVNRLKALAEENRFQFAYTTFLKLFRQMMQSLRLPFTGEPIRGLQIMGVLETRNLDFDHVFILSVNEGIYPPAPNANSFIPANLRKGFALPTPDYQDAIYAYTFYRLLHQAQQVHLLYNTEDLPHLSGEMSRFLYQLIYESAEQEDGTYQFPNKQGDFRIERHTLSAPVRTLPPVPIVIEKSPEVLKKLHVYTGPSSLTPSALNKYLDCRLKFYYQYVAGLRESEMVQAEVDPAVFGTILHRAMELVYGEHAPQTQESVITAEVVKRLKEESLIPAVKKAFNEHFHLQQDEALEGRSIIAFEIVLKMAHRIMEMDAEYAPFEIVSLEAGEGRGYGMVLPITVPHGERLPVALRGIIDRVDRKERVVRVLDYKTGRDEKRIKTIASLFDRDDPQRNKAAMQALFYALLYTENTTADEQVTPGLVNAKELFTHDFDVRLILDRKPLDDFREVKEEFVPHLVAVLEELFDPAIPFDQTTDERKCGYCPFVKLCY